MAKNYLLRRGPNYYFRMKVPVDLREALGKKEIKSALRTSDFREASRRVKLEAVRADARFAEERSKLKPGSFQKEKRQILESEALLLVARWFADLERQSEEAFEADLDIFQRPEDLQEAIQTACVDEFVFAGGGQIGDLWYEGANGYRILENFLREKRLSFSGDPDARQRLAGVLRRGHLEIIRRDLCRLQQLPLPPLGKICSPSGSGDFSMEILRDPSSGSLPRGSTVGQLLDLFMQEQEKAGRAEATLRTYQVPVRLLREVLGEKTVLNSVDRNSIAGLRDLIVALPANARTRYRGKDLKDAIEIAKRDGVPPIEPKTAANYYRNIHAIFGFAVKTGMIARNPASDEWLRKSFEKKKKTGKKRATFTAATLPRVLESLIHPKASIAAKVNRSSGRFWVPFLGLFQGFRLNEACQLYTEDVGCEGGIWFIRIRESREDGSTCEKKLKTSSSERTVPIHPALITMGFLSFLEKRRKDKRSARLFPDLTLGKKGYYSDPFQKWFSRFLQGTLGADANLSFHCFRHTWRDALRVAKVPNEVVKRLGGWTEGGDVQSQYGQGYPLAMLHEELSKVSFPEIANLPGMNG